MRVVAIGDIGVVDGMIHLGDEAMFEALLIALRARGLTGLTALSASPEESAARYGIRAIAPIGFGRDRAANRERMRRVIRTAAGESGLLAADDPALAVIAAVAEAAGVAVAGGGNLASTWPHHVAERATLGGIARALGRPLVVSGQTIGPELTDEDAALVRQLLDSAALVGLREPASFERCRGLGLSRLTATIDDASHLGAPGAEPDDGTLVSLAGHVGSADRDAVIDAAARLLDELAAHTERPTRFLAHFGSIDPAQSRGDGIMHDRVIAAMSTETRVIPPTDAVTAARLARGAAMVVTSRYHPAVFAVPAGVPTVGIPVDDYTAVKLGGALGTFGQHTLLPVTRLLAGEGTVVAQRAWGERTVTRERAQALAPGAIAESERWWDRVATALVGAPQS